MSKLEKIIFLPLDNRPVSYLLPKQIADFSSIDLIMPERKYLGDLKKNADLNNIEGWLNNLVGNSRDCSLQMIISLDTWIYGGLVQSRKHDFTLDELKSRVDFFKNYCKGLRPQVLTIYGFSSIMRIPNYNSDEEEKYYWRDYGEKIFKWSELMYKVGRGIKEAECTHEELIERWYQSTNEIPPQILADYRGLRDKNFSVNMLWLESLHDACFDYLIFSCDDSGKYGMNIAEAEYLKQQIYSHKLGECSKVMSGTDEIPLLLMTKIVLKKSNFTPTVSIVWGSENGKNCNVNYESGSISDSLSNQINILDLTVKNLNDSDVCLCIHVPESLQGDHVFNKEPDKTKNSVEKIIKTVKELNKPFIIIDLAYANGADPVLVESLFETNIDWKMCYGYSAWNTSSNAIGSALAIGINRLLAEKENRFNENKFKKCLLTRFLDDYAYQAKIRHSEITQEETNVKIKSYEKKIIKLLGLDNLEVRYKLPWKRSFEIEVEV